MIEVKIPAEIQDYKSKFIMGLSIRQFVSVAGAILVGGAIGVLGKDKISEDILPWLVMLSVVPFAGYGFFKIHDMKFEEFIITKVHLFISIPVAFVIIHQFQVTTSSIIFNKTVTI